MNDIHCHSCGGFIADVATVSYRLPDPRLDPAVPHDSLCGCRRAIVYGPPAGYLSWPGLSIHTPASRP